MAVQIKPKITDADLLALGDVRAEVIDGEIVIDGTYLRIDHADCLSRLSAFIGAFANSRGLGRVGGMTTPFILDGGSMTGIREALTPYLFYVSYDRFPRNANADIFPEFAPDLAIEIITESEAHNAILRKKNEYLDHGTTQVWHMIPFVRQVHTFTASNRSGIILEDSDSLSGGDLLPGFSIPVRAIFDIDDAALQGETLRGLLP